MRITATAPGRICLFGEHQDYLGLPVIAAAIDLALKIDLVTEAPALNRYRLVLHDLDREEIIDTAAPVVYSRGRDYLRSVIKTLRAEGVDLPKALTAEVTSRIPISAGTSSSTALSMAWSAALLAAADHPRAADPNFVARLSHQAEVVEFAESGGKMDQMSIGHGGLIWFHERSTPPVEALPARPDGFVLGDSREPKDTQAVLSRVRRTAEGAVAKAAHVDPRFSLHETALEDTAACAARAGLDDGEKAALLGNIENRDILRRARALLGARDFDPEELGRLLGRHHEILRDNLGISTPKIERMIAGAMQAGALGCKINGSGGGGCMFAYAPGRTREAAAAIEAAGGAAYLVSVTAGLTVRSRPE